jgi:perosamine synthetase
MMIPVAVPYIARNSSLYVNEALADAAISGLFGRFLPEFERSFAEYIGVDHAVTCSNGTTALHLALAAYGIGPGDEVLVSSITNMASFYAVLYCGATPVPVDVDLDTLCMSSEDCLRKISPRTRGVMIVHLFGQSAEMDRLSSIAAEHGLAVFEDCAESHGATYDGKQTGSWGAAGCFSFFANKIVNTGEGGMVTTNDAALADRMRSMRSLSFGKVDKFLHEGIGFNYRMDNLKAALGCAQMEEIEKLVAAKTRMGQVYNELFCKEQRLILPVARQRAKNVYWMYHVRLADDVAPRRNEILGKLRDEGIETRPGFVSYTLQPFADKAIVAANPCPVAERVSYSTFYLPSSHDISETVQSHVAQTLINYLD